MARDRPGKFVKKRADIFLAIAPRCRRFRGARSVLLVVLLLVTLGLGPVARADFQLDFVYNPITGATTASYSGSWGSWSGAIQDTGASGGISETGFAHYGSQSSYINTAVFSGATIPWSANTTSSSMTGDAWGFTGTRVIAPYNYTANTVISGSLVFSGLDLTILGFDATEIANGGTIGSGNFVVHWTASSPIPEPGSDSLCLGLIALGALVRLRARRVS